MRPVLVSLALVVIFPVSSAQSQTRSAKHRIVELPRDEVVMVIVSQPESPLKLEAVSFFRDLDNGKVLQRFRVRNISAKAIAAFTVNSWSMTGSGGTLPVLLANTNTILCPGETLDSFHGEDYEILKLDDIVRKKLKHDFDINLAGKIQNIFFLMVDMVGFIDGTRFSDGSLKEKLGLYLTEHYRFPE
jgi:hypothetical protein